MGVLYYKRKENNYKIDLNKTIEELLIQIRQIKF